MNQNTFSTPYIDCACVIHGDYYDWSYVEKLYSMLCRNLSLEVRLHVYTEATRTVPDHMIKHSLYDWGIHGPNRAWWYKMQLFNNSDDHMMLYFDLDVVIVDNIDWVWQLNPSFFWAIRDFKSRWRPTFYGINSSMMWWKPSSYKWLWDSFAKTDFNTTIRKYRGDQDYITMQMSKKNLRYFDSKYVKSWRWEVYRGGFDVHRNKYNVPETEPTRLLPETSVLIFHGDPKPKDIQDKIIIDNWS